MRKKSAATLAGEVVTVDLNAALKWLNASVTDSFGYVLREPEIVILKGTWRGLTYEQMANDSDYSTNYLMRDVAPKLWKQLSSIFGRSVGKTNFRVALEAYAAANIRSQIEFRSLDFDANVSNNTLVDVGASHSFNGSDIKGSEAGSSIGSSIGSSARELSAYPEGDAATDIRWHPAVLPEVVGDRPSENFLNAGFLSASYSTSYSTGVLSKTPAQNFYKTLYSGVSIQAMSAAVMYGYADEFAQAQQWIGEALTSSNSSQPTGQLVGIWGLRGMGKTLLAEKLVAQMGDRFEGVAWRSLASGPSIQALSASILTGLGVAPQGNQAAATHLLALMAQKRLLIVLDGAEAILCPGALAGDYQAEYQDYGEFFQAAMGSQSCVLVTGIEGPADLVRQGGYSRRQNVRSLMLSRLSESAATDLLKAEQRAEQQAKQQAKHWTNPTTTLGESLEANLEASLEAADSLKNGGSISSMSSISESIDDSELADPWQAQWPELIARYQGHPLALKAALRVVREIFNDRVDEFLKQRSVLFTDILRLLAPSFDRLSPLEVNILNWLASQETPLSLTDLKQTLPIPVSSAKLISALDSLKQRSLLEINTETASPTFYPPALVKAYAVHQFIGRFGETDAIANPASTAQTHAQTHDRQALDPTMPWSNHSSDHAAYRITENIIDLSPPPQNSVQLSQWFQGQFDADWQSLERLFEASARPAMRLRSAYHLQDEAFIKRCKSIDLSSKSTLSDDGRQDDNQSDNKDGNQNDNQDDLAIKDTETAKIFPRQANSRFDRAVLLVAIHQDAENLYKICVQAQPAKDASVLPENLELRLIDTQQKVLATVAAQADDSFIQLPYFRGAIDEPFAIDIILKDRHHTETFVI